MICREVEELIHAYSDGELDLVRSLEIERHFQDCPACSGLLERIRALRFAVSKSTPYYPAPAGLEARLRSRLREGAPVKPQAPRRMLHSWQWAGVAAAVLIAAVSVGLLMRRPATTDLLAREVVAGHVRSMMASHLTDVPSTDQHTVKPWFNGRLDFSPTVGDFRAQDFPLTGGRLDYLGNRPVAALVYRRRQHVINLFIWPASAQPDSNVVQRDIQGYHLLQWNKSGMAYWAVSDLNAAELYQFAGLVRTL